MEVTIKQVKEIIDWLAEMEYEREIILSLIPYERTNEKLVGKPKGAHLYSDEQNFLDENRSVIITTLTARENLFENLLQELTDPKVFIDYELPFIKAYRAHQKRFLNSDQYMEIKKIIYDKLKNNFHSYATIETRFQTYWADLTKRANTDPKIKMILEKIDGEFIERQFYEDIPF